jgi:hypothetical protein
MPQILHTRPHLARPHLARPHVTLLNNDGRRHPLQNSLAVTTVALGMITLVLGLIVQAHVLGAVLAVINFPLALYSQLTSATIGERWLNVVGLIATAVGFALSLAHGGFTPW